MKTCNGNHLLIVNQGYNINQLADKMNLNIFKSKRVKKYCYRFLFSIVTLSFLSITNTSFAFPGLARNGRLSLFYAPTNNSNQKPYIRLDQYSLVDVLYCRKDKWCYILGYYSKGRYQAVGYFPEKAWVMSNQLCDKLSNDLSNPLPNCRGNSDEFDGIVASGKKFKEFFCSSIPDENNNLVTNPWRWLFLQGNSNFCGDLNR